MPNANYIKGRRKEYKIKNELLSEGCDIAQRTAGSRSPFDVIGINIDKKIIKLIQCKPDTMSKKDQDKIRNENIKLNGMFQIVFKVI